MIFAFCRQHAHAGFSLGLCVRQTVLHQFFAVALTFAAAGNPQAVKVKIIFALYGHPCALKRGVLNKSSSLRIQLPEDMAFFQPVRKPLPFCLDPGMWLFAADNAA